MGLAVRRSLSGSWLQIPQLDTGDDESSLRKGRPSTLRRLFRAARADCIAVPFAILGVLLAASSAPAQEPGLGRCPEMLGDVGWKEKGMAVQQHG